MERYDSIVSSASRLAKGDSDLTADVVQDAFIQFTLNGPQLDEITNLDGYLYVLLKNLCLANFRRNGKNRLEQFSIYEYDSAGLAFSRLDLRDVENARDELRRICSILSVRKSNATTSGVFILRFFSRLFSE